MRTAFINQLIEEARKNKEIFLIVGDLGFSVVEPFAKEFPDRFLNAGVAEQNMTGIAAGLAKEGFTVLTYSIGNFPTLRCMEQIRYDVCYHNLNVKIVTVGGGFAYGPLGASHHATEDIAMLRVLPNISICAPADPIETKIITSEIIKHRGPCYLRLGKAGELKIHDNSLIFNWGKMIKVKEGSEIVVLSTGAMLKYSLDYIQNNNLSWGLYSVPFIKPIDSSTLNFIANKYKKIITIEEHQKSGGFGSALLEALNILDNDSKINKMPKVEIIGIEDEFISVAGSQGYLRELSGLKFD